MPSLPFSVALFDLDGTLVDSANLIAKAVQDTFVAEKLPAPSVDDVMGYIGVPLEVYFPLLAGDAYEDAGGDALVVKYRERMDEMLLAGNLKTFDGIERMLTGLKDGGVKTGLVTSKAVDQAVLSCRVAKIEHLIDVCVGADSVLHPKPAAEPTLKALEMLDHTPPGAHVCMVGDADGDIATGRDAGCTTCAVSWGAHSRERLLAAGPTKMVDSVSELSAFLGV